MDPVTKYYRDRHRFISSFWKKRRQLLNVGLLFTPRHIYDEPRESRDLLAARRDQWSSLFVYQIISEKDFPEQEKYLGPVGNNKVKYPNGLGEFGDPLVDLSYEVPTGVSSVTRSFSIAMLENLVDLLSKPQFHTTEKREHRDAVNWVWARDVRRRSDDVTFDEVCWICHLNPDAVFDRFRKVGWLPDAYQIGPQPRVMKIPPLSQIKFSKVMKIPPLDQVTLPPPLRSPRPPFVPKPKPARHPQYRRWSTLSAYEEWKADVDRQIDAEPEPNVGTGVDRQIDAEPEPSERAGADKGWVERRQAAMERREKRLAAETEEKKPYVAKPKWLYRPILGGSNR